MVMGSSDGLIPLGSAIPDTPHAVSVSLPSWEANVGYEKGERWVIDKMKNGYPRFFVHLSIRAFAAVIIRKHGSSRDCALLFPSPAIAGRCVDFLISQDTLSPSAEHKVPSIKDEKVRILDLTYQDPNVHHSTSVYSGVILSVVLFPESYHQIASKFWQHSGDGVSSRRAEFLHKEFDKGHLVPRNNKSQTHSFEKLLHKGPKRYQKESSASTEAHKQSRNKSVAETERSGEPKEPGDYVQFVEERFGRNLDMALAQNAKLAIRRRIAGSLIADIPLEEALDMPFENVTMRQQHGFTVQDVYLYPTGMSAIYNTHRALLETRGDLKSIMFGFPYIDTLKVLEKFGPGAVFYGHGSTADLDDLEKRCRGGEHFLALFCEFPGNPLLKTPDLTRIKILAKQYDFAVVVDETIGNFLNVDVLHSADVVVSSLTKVFSGDCNVMGGSCVLNPEGIYYRRLCAFLANEYEDNYWPEDAIFLERNSRDFVIRNQRININAEAICQVLVSSPYGLSVKGVFYPKYGDSKKYFERFKTDNGGYGGLFSVTFDSITEAAQFFDFLETAKGPSLGTNFTLTSPFVILAHYHELEWAATYGAEANLVRVSVGMEDTHELCAIFQHALKSIKRLREQCKKCQSQEFHNILIKNFRETIWSLWSPGFDFDLFISLVCSLLLLQLLGKRTE